MYSSRIFGLDLFRAIAVSLVLISHASFFLSPLKPNYDLLLLLGYFGVDLFFVLSGFLIGGLLIENAGSGGGWVGRFWIRRWLRTIPNYYLFLLINIILFYWAEGRFPVFFSYIFFLQNWAWPHPQFFQEAWSLALEEIFYLMAPLSMLPFLIWRQRRELILLILISALAMALFLRVVYVLDNNPSWDEGVRKITSLRLDSIGYGTLVAYLCKRYRWSYILQQRLALLGALGSVIAALLYLELSRDQSVLARTALFSLTPLSFAALFPLIAHWKATRLPVIFVSAIRQLALWSYALYLVHLPILRVIDKLGIKASSPISCYILMLGFMALSVTLAALFYRWYEYPILYLRDRCFPTREYGALPSLERS